MQLFSKLMCINFNQFDLMMGYTGDCELSVLFGAIRYQIGHTKIKRDGKNVIARSKGQLAAAMGCSKTVITARLQKLKELGLIDWVVGMWYGKKRLFLSCREDLDLKLNIKKIEFMNKYTGSTKASIMLSYFAYELEKGYFIRRGVPWIMRARKEVAKNLQIDGRTADGLIKDLVSKGLIQYEGTYRFACRQYCVHINEDFYNKMVYEWEAIVEKDKLDKLKAESTKAALSNNNSDLDSVEIKDNNIAKSESGIISNQDACKLTNQELRYAKAAVERTVLRAKVAIGDINRLWQEVKFALLTPQHRKGTQNFKHAVNRFMLLIRTGGWKMPFGYEKYSEDGRKEYERLRADEKAHYESKPAKAQQRLAEAGYLPPNIERKSLQRSESNVERIGGVEYFKAAEPKKPIDESKRAALADLERRWEESRYGGGHERTSFVFTN